MRILIVNKFYHLFGGTERYVRELTELLQHKGHEVVPFAVADSRNEPTPYADYFVSPVEFFDRQQRPAPWALAERVIYSREAREKITQLIETVRPDLAHVHNIYHHISPSVLDGLKSCGIPIVMTLHDYKLICPTYSLWTEGAVCERCCGGHYYHCVLHRCSHGSLAGSLLNTAEAYIHRKLRIYDNVDLFVSPSAFLLEKHTIAGWDSTKMVHIPNFLVLENYVPHYGHRGYFAYAGRLASYKGVRTLLSAVARVKPSIPLVIAGDGPERSGLEREAAQLGLGGVRFLGHLGESQVRDLVAHAAFVVVPSEWHENSPYAVLEAMALGTPVLASSSGGIPELIEDGLNGVLVPSGDVDALAAGIETMLTYGPQLGDMGRAGRQRVEQFHNGERHYAALSDVYGRVRQD
jgi:glycosyltransferase involved in cell wall biosynthesis